MSTKEKIYSLIDGFTEEQLAQVLAMLGSVKNMLQSEQEDDEYCHKLLEDYRNDTDPDKTESVPLETFARELGININELLDTDCIACPYVHRVSARKSADADFKGYSRLARQWRHKAVKRRNIIFPSACR